MAKGQIGRKQAAPVKYDSEGKRITPGVKYDSEGKRINSNSTPQSTPKSSSTNAARRLRILATPKSTTAQVPPGGAALPTKGNSAMASLARSFIKNGVGKLIPGVGLVLTAVQVADYLGGGETAANEPVKSRGQMGRPPKEKESESSQKRAERVTRDEPFDITELKMREDQKNPRNVLPAPRPRSAMDAARDAKEAASRVVEKVVGSDSSRPLPVDTKSKKPLAKRIMEALGDNRDMAQATRDRKMTEEMEMEREMNVAGRKKGGMAKKKKAPVKKAYGGMVKKKHGGSANKVNMKAGFTRRGCSKG
jgi:hypothetical protein